MYRTHWGLREIPFQSSSTARFYYETPAQEEALARLHYMVDEQRRVGFVLGINGGGKSLLLDIFDKQIRRQGTQVVHLSLLGVDTHEMLWSIAADLGTNPDREETDFQLWRQITDCLSANQQHGTPTVFLFDDADEADPLVLDTLVRLIEAERNAQVPLTFILTATPNQVRRLPTRLLGLAELRINLDAWEECDTANYLYESLRQAGRHDTPFSSDAIRKLHQLSGGVPRRISQLANLTLLAGAGRNIHRIDAETVESAWHELGFAEVA